MCSTPVGVLCNSKTVNTPRLSLIETSSHHIQSVDAVDGSRVLQVIKDLSECLNDAQKLNLLEHLTSHMSLGHLESIRLASRLHSKCDRSKDCHDFVAWLPSELVLCIFSHLSWVDLIACSQVNRAWFDASRHPTLYRRLCQLPEWRIPPLEHQCSQVSHAESLSSAPVSPQSSDSNGSSGISSEFEFDTVAVDRIDWFRLFRKRVQLRQNWLRGRHRIRKFTGHTEAIYCVAYDTFRIASGSADATIRVWNVRTNAAWSVQTLRGHSSAVRCIQLLPLPQEQSRNSCLDSVSTLEAPEAILISGSADTTIKLWRLSAALKWSRITCTSTLQGHTDAVRCLQADHRKVISGSYDCTLRLWNLKTNQLNHTFHGHTGGVVCLFYDEYLLYSGSLDNTVRVWCLNSMSCLYVLRRSSIAPESHYWLTHVSSLHLDAPRHRLLMAYHDGVVLAWSIPTTNRIPPSDADPTTVSLTERFDRDGILAGTVVRCIEGDGWHIVCGTDDKTLKVWCADDNQMVGVLKGHEDGITCAVVTSSVLVSGSYDKSVLLYDFDIT